MRRILATLVLCGCWAAAPADTMVPDHPAEQVSDHVYVIHGPTEYPTPENRGFINNPAFVVTADAVVVLDPGSSVHIGEMVLRQIARVTDKPVSHVFITHVHGDHWLGNQAIQDAYPEAEILAHPEMIRRAHAGEADAWLALMSRLTGGATDATEAVVPAVELVDGQELTVGGITFRVHLTEHAHTKTDAMIEVVEDGLIALGDNGLYGRIARMDDGSFRGNIAALERALSLELDHYLPGHGRTAGPEAASEYLEYLRRVYAAAAAGIEEGMQYYEVKEVLRPRMAAWADWPGFEEEFGRHVSLASLEAEQAAFE